MAILSEEAMAPSAPPHQPSRKSSKSFSNKRRICFGVAVFLLIVGAGAGTAAALLLGERNDSAANANTAEGSDPQEGTAISPSISPVMQPSALVPLEPTVQGTTFPTHISF